jgi:DNA polymerase-1
VAPTEQQALTDLVRREMAAAALLRLPLDVSVGVGHSWDAAAH